MHASRLVYVNLLLSFARKQFSTLRSILVTNAIPIREPLTHQPTDHLLTVVLTKSVFQAGVLNRCCRPPEAILSRTAISSLSKDTTFRLDSIRDGVTDLGRTTVPLLTAQEMRMVATDSLCLSAIFFNSGSEWRGESAVSIDH